MTTWLPPAIPALHSVPEYWAFARAMEVAPEDRTARAVFADWLGDRGYEAEAAAFRASAEDATEYAPVPVELRGGEDAGHSYHVRRYHDAERTAYTFVGVWHTLLGAVSAFVRWHLRGEWETKCSVCPIAVVDPNRVCANCKGSGWVPICEHGNCEHPGEDVARPSPLRGT